MQNSGSMPKIPVMPRGLINPVDNVLDLATSALYGGNGQTAIAKGMMNMSPVNEQSMRKSRDTRLGCGQDDSMPNIPTVSIGVA